MRTVVGAGCWPGRADGPVVWLDSVTEFSRGVVADRPAEILRFKAAVAGAVQDLEAWCEGQQTLEASMALQSYKDALLADAWLRRTAALIDAEALPAAAAAYDAAQHLSAVMARSEELRERAESLVAAARWLSLRLEPPPALRRITPDAILAAERLSPAELLDLRYPTVLAGPEPVILGSRPLVWGVPGLGPEWAGRRIAIDGATVTLDPPDPGWWVLHDDFLRGLPVCHVDGDPEAVARMARHLGQPPAVLIRRLDDLAAVALFAPHAAAIAVDLERLGRSVSLKHPGVLLLLKAAAGTGLPFLAGGKPAVNATDPDYWLRLGFTGFYGHQPPQGGAHLHAIRRGSESGL